MPAQTPWAQQRSREPEPISCWTNNGWIAIRAGATDRSPIGRIRTEDLVIQVANGSGASPVTVPSYSLQLERWTRGEIPVIHMHPFGLLHMMATGQYNRLLLIAAMANIGRAGRERVFVPLDRTSDILTMLRVNGAMVSLTTANNLEVRDRA